MCIEIGSDFHDCFLCTYPLFSAVNVSEIIICGSNVQQELDGEMGDFVTR